jgi:hypothetical protein
VINAARMVQPVSSGRCHASLTFLRHRGSSGDAKIDPGAMSDNVGEKADDDGKRNGRALLLLRSASNVLSLPPTSQAFQLLSTWVSVVKSFLRKLGAAHRNDGAANRNYRFRLLNSSAITCTISACTVCTKK